MFQCILEALPPDSDFLGLLSSHFACDPVVFVVVRQRRAYTLWPKAPRVGNLMTDIPQEPSLLEFARRLPKVEVRFEAPQHTQSAE